MPTFPDANPLFVLAVVVLAGVAFGALARRVHLPGITGQIVVGVLIGRAGLGLFEEEAVDRLAPVTHFALALMAVTIGAHLSLRRLRNAGKRLFLLLLAEATITPALVYGATIALPGMSWWSALLLGALAVSTAPITTIAMVKEMRARGVFVKTLVAAVALNNVACILLFEMAHAVARVELEEGRHDLAALAFVPAAQLGLAFAIGGVAAVGMNVAGRFVRRPELLATAGAAAILAAAGFAAWIEVSPLLACMFLGMIQANTVAARDRLADTVFANFEPAIIAVFFTLAGMHLSFEQAGLAGVAALVFFAARAAGKVVSAGLAMRLAGATASVRRWLGVALLPQAGIAIGLVLLLETDPVFRQHPLVLDLFVAVVLTVVTMNEIVGPILMRHALARAGEVGKDRQRLIDFLQEENIVTDLRADTMEEAIERLVDLMIHSHHLDRADRVGLLESVLERERQAPTALGGGLAVPHGVLPAGSGMVGVMGLSRRGLPLDTPDGRPVHCIVLLATARGERDRHLQVLAMLARTIGADETFQERLYRARSPAHAYELLHGEESEGFNYFLAG